MEATELCYIPATQLAAVIRHAEALVLRAAAAFEAAAPWAHRRPPVD